MVELLERNKHHNLTDFQKHTLKHLRNQSMRSKMIVFGDCVDQFEHMVDRRSKLYESMQGFKKVTLLQEQNDENARSTTRDDDQERRQMGFDGHSYHLQSKEGQSVVFASAAGTNKDGSPNHLLRIVPHDSTPDQQRVLVHQQVQTPTQNTDSLFSLHQANSSHVTNNTINLL